MEGQMSLYDLGIWSGKMCREPLAATAARTSESSLKKSQGSAKKLPLFLDLRGNGEAQGASWVMGGLLLGEYMMRSFGESPKEENASLLSQILEDTPHPKYCLSARACSGILARAARRGKELPPELKKALEEQSASKNEPGNMGGKGLLIQDERTGALSTLNNQMVAAVDVYNQSVYGDIAGAITAAVGGSNTSGAKVLAVDCRNGRENPCTNGTLQAKDGGFSYNLQNVVRVNR